MVGSELHKPRQRRSCNYDLCLNKRCSVINWASLWGSTLHPTCLPTLAWPTARITGGRYCRADHVNRPIKKNQWWRTVPKRGRASGTRKSPNDALPDFALNCPMVPLAVPSAGRGPRGQSERLVGKGSSVKMFQPFYRAWRAATRLVVTTSLSGRC